jgi:beta-N-acetylhexosaminidase
VRFPILAVAVGASALCAAIFFTPYLSADSSVPATSPKKRAAPASATPKPSSETATVARWMKGMTLRDEVAQMVMIPFNGRPLHPRTKAFRDFTRMVGTEHVGGMILVNVTQGRVVAKAEPLDVASFLNKMQRMSKVPLLVSADLERGASMRLNSSTVFPHAMAFAAARDTDAVRFEGETTAKEARAVGIQWVFFPVADINNNPDNPIINIRSYGENPEDVSKLVDAYIEGAHAATKSPVLTTVKHFPGHGDTATDSHMNMPVIGADRERLDKLEFVPFRSAISHGVDSVMTAHISVPAIDASDVPATLSPKIMTGLLRNEFGFKGLIITDALEMGGIIKGFGVGEAAVRAVEAGADVLLMPPDPHVAIEAVMAAVKSGRIDQKRIHQSVARLLSAKARLGLSAGGVVDLEEIQNILNSPESNARAQTLADESVTLLRNADSLVPLRNPARTCFWSLAESRSSTEGVVLSAEIKKRSPASLVMMADVTMTDDDLHRMEESASACEANVIAAFVSASAYKGNVSIGGQFPALLTRLMETKKPLALISFGNPYLLRDYSGVQAYLAMYSTVPPSEIAAVRALWGEIAVRGKLPVTIPNLAAYGDGIAIPAITKIVPSTSQK